MSDAWVWAVPMGIGGCFVFGVLSAIASSWAARITLLCASMACASMAFYLMATKDGHDDTSNDVTCVYDGKPFANGKSDDRDFADWCERSIKAFDARLCRGCECQAEIDKDGGVYVVGKICPEKKPFLKEEFAEGSGVVEVAK